MQQAEITLQKEKVNNLVTSNQTIRNRPSKYNENNSFLGLWVKLFSKNEPKKGINSQRG